MVVLVQISTEQKSPQYIQSNTKNVLAQTEYLSYADADVIIIFGDTFWWNKLPKLLL